MSMKLVKKRIVVVAASVVVLSVPTAAAIVETGIGTTAELLAGNLTQRLRPGHVRVGAVSTCDPPIDPGAYYNLARTTAFVHLPG